MNLLTIKTMSDGQKIRSFLNYPSYNDALCAFFNELAYATASEDIVGVMVEIIDDEGHVSKCDRYNKPVVHIPEEVTESEGTE